jgi:hypothetical protein
MRLLLPLQEKPLLVCSFISTSRTAGDCLKLSLPVDHMLNLNFNIHLQVKQVGG